MGSFFTGLFGGKQTQQPAAALRITTSLQGVPLPWLLGGQQRLPGNCIWYGGFSAVQQSSGGGGKGGLFGGGGAGSGYVYYASFILAACEGPDIADIPWVWNSGTQQGPTGEADTTNPFVFVGSYTQNEWNPAVTGNQSLYYRGLCYVAYASANLGSSPAIPQINPEVLSTNSYVIPGIPDGDPSVCWAKFFTDPLRGLGFPSARMGNLTQWQQYCFATGLLVSPAIVSAIAASSWAKDLLQATNSNARWSAGLLAVIPYGDQAITQGAIESVTEEHLVPSPGAVPPPDRIAGYSPIEVGFASTFVADGGVVYTSTGLPLTAVNSLPPSAGEYYIDPNLGPGWYVFNENDAGAQVSISYRYAATASYQPNTTPVYALSLDNFLPNEGTIGQGVAVKNSPLIVVRKPRDQMLNVVKVTYLDRGNSYNPVTVEVKNEAALQAFGRWRAAAAKQFDFFCLAAAAQQSAALMLQREQIARTFQWTSGKELILLDVMDIVTVSDPAQGIVNQAVRITEIQENADFSLTFTAEEFLGTAAAPLYNIQANAGYVPNFNASPGNANAPILFEPPDELAGGLYVYAAVSGQNPASWGGCIVNLSLDGENYVPVATINGAARMGVTTADFPVVGVNPAGQTIDQTNTLAVDLTESAGALISGSTQDALSLATACYVGPANGGGEIVAFQNAALTAQYKYGLSYLVRGAYGTEAEIVDHPSGSAFARLDNAIAKIPFNQNQIGSTIFIKFQGFNQYQGGLQELSECAAYSYTLQGSALASPLPAVAGLYSNYASGFQQIFWDEVSDFRSGIVYEIRQGATWATAQVLKTQAHPPFIAQGNGTFWVSARCQPVAGLTVYSETPSSITIAGNQLSLNLLASWDEQATNWQGTFQNGIGVSGPPFGGGLADIRLGGAGNILAESILLQSATATAATAAGGNVLTLSSVANISAGQAVNDTTAATVIPGGTTVQSINAGAKTVTLTNEVTGAGVGNGDTIVFGDPDILSTGGIVTDTPLYYTIPSSHIITSGAIVAASVNASTQIVGVPAGQNILGLTNILNYPDILGSASTQFVDGWIEINVSQDGGSTWGGWQKFIPGVYPGNAWNFRLALESLAANVIPFATAFNYAVQLPARIDHYQNQSVPSGGLTITFALDSSPSTPAPFNGGPGANSAPYVSVSWQATAGDTYQITGLSLSQLTITFYNGGVAVARSGVNIDVEGY